MLDGRRVGGEAVHEEDGDGGGKALDLPELEPQERLARQRLDDALDHAAEAGGHAAVEDEGADATGSEELESREAGLRPARGIGLEQGLHLLVREGSDRAGHAVRLGTEASFLPASDQLEERGGVERAALENGADVRRQSLEVLAHPLDGIHGHASAGYTKGGGVRRGFVGGSSGAASRSRSRSRREWSRSVL